MADPKQAGGGVVVVPEMIDAGEPFDDDAPAATEPTDGGAPVDEESPVSLRELRRDLGMSAAGEGDSQVVVSGVRRTFAQIGGEHLIRWAALKLHIVEKENAGDQDDGVLDNTDATLRLCLIFLGPLIFLLIAWPSMSRQMGQESPVANWQTKVSELVWQLATSPALERLETATSQEALAAAAEQLREIMRKNLLDTRVPAAAFGLVDRHGQRFQPIAKYAADTIDHSISFMIFGDDEEGTPLNAYMIEQMENFGGAENIVRYGPIVILRQYHAVGGAGDFPLVLEITSRPGESLYAPPRRRSPLAWSVAAAAAVLTATAIFLWKTRRRPIPELELPGFRSIDDWRLRLFYLRLRKSPPPQFLQFMRKRQKEKLKNSPEKVAERKK